MYIYVQMWVWLFPNLQILKSLIIFVGGQRNYISITFDFKKVMFAVETPFMVNAHLSEHTKGGKILYIKSYYVWKLIFPRRIGRIPAKKNPYCLIGVDRCVYTLK